MKRYTNQTPSNAHLRRAKVLIIEDNPDHWLLIQQAMQACLPEVERVWVSSVQQAIIQVESWQYQEWEAPRLILQDLYLPDSDNGWQLLSHIKSMPTPFKHIPIVMLSSSVSRLDIRKAYELGVASYLVKPLNFEEWLTYFRELRQYWWKTATLPPVQYSL